MKWMGPTDASRHPRPAPWIFRGDNPAFVFVAALTIALIYIVAQ